MKTFSRIRKMVLLQCYLYFVVARPMWVACFSAEKSNEKKRRRKKEKAFCTSKEFGGSSLLSTTPKSRDFSFHPIHLFHWKKFRRKWIDSRFPVSFIDMACMYIKKGVAMAAGLPPYLFYGTRLTNNFCTFFSGEVCVYLVCV